VYSHFNVRVLEESGPVNRQQPRITSRQLVIRSQAHVAVRDHSPCGLRLLPVVEVQRCGIKLAVMRKLSLVVLLFGSVLLAQESNPSNPSRQDSKTSNGQTTVQGCVSRSSGDYILMQQDPGMTYQLHATGRIKLSHYLGQQVEVIGEESPSLSTSSNPAGRVGSASVALTISSIKTIEKRCSAR